ncbi:hypothetical protein, partial [Amycolatopsis decaplanina]
AFLESRPQPPGFGLKTKDRPRSSQKAKNWINAWVKDLHGEEMTLQAVVDLSGRLVSQTQVSELWQRLKGPEIPEDVPVDVVDWRPAPDGTGPRTLRDYLNTRGGLPDGFELKSASRPRSNKLAQGWINAWAAKLYGKMAYAKVAELSDGLIGKNQVGVLWGAIADEPDAGVSEGDVPGGGGSSDSGVLTRPEVVGWRPAKDGTGPRTLKAFLESRPQPPGFGLKTKDRPRSSQMAKNWINAWVKDLHEEMTQAEVVKLSGELVGQNQIGRLWRRLDRPWIPEDVPVDVVDWRPAPDDTEPRTLRDYLNTRGDLPAGFTLKPKGRTGAITSAVAQGWINAWAGKLYGKMAYAKVAELSDGLIGKNQVGVLWGAIANKPDAGVSEGDVPGGGGSSDSGVLTRPEVVGWRPAEDGTGPRTLRAFLESRPHPAGFGLKSKDRPHSSQMAQEWINAWAGKLREKMTQAEVVKLSGELVSYPLVSLLWRRLKGPEIPEGVPVDVVGWRPAPDGTGPRTFRDFLNTRGDLPAGFTLKSKGRKGSRASVVAQGWINAWAAKLYGKMPQADVAKLSDGLINRNLVGALWAGLAMESDAGVSEGDVSGAGPVPGEGGGSSVPGVLTRPEVVGWRPAEDGTGPRTLRAFLESRPQPAGFKLKTGNRPRSSQMAQEWVDAWVAGLHGKKSQAEVVDLSGVLVSQTQVSVLWRRLKGPEIPEGVPVDVVGWRPA